MTALDREGAYDNYKTSFENLINSPESGLEPEIIDYYSAHPFSESKYDAIKNKKLINAIFTEVETNQSSAISGAVGQAQDNVIQYLKENINNLFRVIDNPEYPDSSTDKYIFEVKDET